MAVSVDYALQTVKGIKESFDNGSRYALEQYMSIPVFNIESTDEWAEIFTSTEGLGGAKETAELETPDVNKLQDGYSVTLISKRYTNAILISSTAMQQMDDNSTKVDTFITRERDKVLRSLKYLFVQHLHQFFNDAFDSGSELVAPDGVELCGSHSWNTPGSAAWDNSATAALSSAAVDAAMEFGGAFVDGNGEAMPQTYDTIVVKLGSAAARTAKKLFAENITPEKVDNINIYQGEFTIIETPEITAANKAYWFMFDTSKEMSPLYVGVKQFPTMKEPIVQDSQAVRSNVEGFWKRGINNMPNAIYGSTGAA